MSKWFVAFAICFLAAGAASGSQQIPGPPQTQPVILRGGTVHPVSGPEIPGGEVIFDHGKITAVGEHLTVPENAKAIDVSGKHVYPGLISANTVLGLAEITAVRSTLDDVETGAINPNVTAQTAINPDSELLPVARTNGVLSALVVPKTSGLIAGTSTLINLDGWTAQTMTVKQPVGLHVFWPDMAINRDPRFPKKSEDQEKELVARVRQLKEAFTTARVYAAGLAAGDGANVPAAPRATDVRLAAIVPAVRGEMPVFIHADSLLEIESAVAWAVEQKLKLILVGGQDAWRAAALLKEHDIPVIVGPINTLPARRWEGFDTPFRNPARLQAAGVRFCIAGGGGEFDAMQERNLPYQAAKAAAYGLSKEEALKSVTLYPAQILGVADRLGSIETGKDANLIITTGDPLEITSQVELAFIGGRAVDLANKQTRLRDKYQQKYPQ